MANKTKSNSTSVTGKRKRGQQSAGRQGQGTLMTTVGGATNVKANSAIVVPRAITTTCNNGAVVRIANTEVWSALWPVDTGDTFGVTGVYINPVQRLTWAGSIAINFSKYRFTKLRFHYRPIVGTTAGGFFAMAFATDPEDATAVDTLTSANTLSRLVNSRRYVQVPVWQEAVMDVQPSDFSQSWYLVEASTVSDQATARQCTAGAFFQSALAANDLATGILYVEYVLELMDPVNALVNR
jgi:hypothetical protein